MSTTTATSASTECTTAVPGKYGNVPVDACNSLYNFNPQQAPAIAVAVLFSILTTIHIVEAVFYKKRYAWVLTMGALWESIAFVLHALGAHDQQNAGYATPYTILFLLAPLWINAFVYMTLSRAVYLFKPDHKVLFVKAVYMSRCFVLADILTFLVQGAGGVMAVPGAPAHIIKLGLNIYLAGLGFQEFFIVVFVGLMIAFHRNCLAIGQSAGYTTGPNGIFGDFKQRNWKTLLYTLYAVLIFISIRIFYRIAEFAGGITLSNPLPFHEEYGYALDALPMLLCLVILAINHPGRVLQGPDSELPHKSRKEKMAEKQAKKERKAQAKADKKTSKTPLSHIELTTPEYSEDERSIRHEVGYDAHNDNATAESGRC